MILNSSAVLFVTGKGVIPRVFQEFQRLRRIHALLVANSAPSEVLEELRAVLEELGSGEMGLEAWSKASALMNQAVDEMEVSRAACTPQYTHQALRKTHRTTVPLHYGTPCTIVHHTTCQGVRVVPLHHTQTPPLLTVPCMQAAGPCCAAEVHVVHAWSCLLCAEVHVVQASQVKELQDQLGSAMSLLQECQPLAMHLGMRASRGGGPGTCCISPTAHAPSPHASPRAVPGAGEG